MKILDVVLFDKVKLTFYFILRLLDQILPFLEALSFSQANVILIEISQESKPMNPLLPYIQPFLLLKVLQAGLLEVEISLFDRELDRHVDPLRDNPGIDPAPRSVFQI